MPKVPYLLNNLRPNTWRVQNTRCRNQLWLSVTSLTWIPFNKLPWRCTRHLYKFTLPKKYSRLTTAQLLRPIADFCGRSLGDIKRELREIFSKTKLQNTLPMTSCRSSRRVISMGKYLIYSVRLNFVQYISSSNGNRTLLRNAAWRTVVTGAGEERD